MKLNLKMQFFLYNFDYIGEKIDIGNGLVIKRNDGELLAIIYISDTRVRQISRSPFYYCKKL
jgi:hypothetical protein